jgi:hypothetical protein
MRAKKSTPRSDYRQKESLRTSQSAPLAEKFEELKALTVEFSYLNPDGGSRNRQIKYTVNIERARSVFRIDCLNHECVGGDFDLSDRLADAVAARLNTVSGEMKCEGWQDKDSIDKVHCHHILSYKLALEYQRRSAAKSSAARA